MAADAQKTLLFIPIMIVPPLDGFISSYLLTSTMPTLPKPSCGSLLESRCAITNHPTIQINWPNQLPMGSLAGPLTSFSSCPTLFWNSHP
jgi:hypothetical protein